MSVSFVLLSDSVILSTRKEQRLLFSLEPIRAQLPKAGIETALPLRSRDSGTPFLCDPGQLPGSGVEEAGSLPLQSPY